MFHFCIAFNNRKFSLCGRDKSYFVKSHSKSNNKYTQEEIIQMLDFLVDNIFVLFGERGFQQTICIPMGRNCAPLLTDMFLNAYEADFLQGFVPSTVIFWTELSC